MITIKNTDITVRGMSRAFNVKGEDGIQYSGRLDVTTHVLDMAINSVLGVISKACIQLSGEEWVQTPDSESTIDHATCVAIAGDFQTQLINMGLWDNY